MNEKAKKARNLYAKQWREKNPDKVKRYVENFWSKKGKEMEQQETDSDSKEGG